MKKRSEQEWRNLFAQQAASGISAQQFCKANEVCPKHFSIRKKQLGLRQSAFVPIVHSTHSTPTSIPPKNTVHALVLQQGSYILRFETIPAPDWLAHLLRALA
jgi:hypothetical protein